MSRFNATDKKGRRYCYGYDRPLQYFFLSRETPKLKHIVGLLSGTVRKQEVYGSASNLLEYINRLKIEIPLRHREELLLNLPLSPLPEPEEGSEFEASLDVFGAG
jgi:hypothetical protein